MQIKFGESSTSLFNEFVTLKIFVTKETTKKYFTMETIKILLLLLLVSLATPRELISEEEYHYEDTNSNSQESSEENTTTPSSTVEWSTSTTPPGNDTTTTPNPSATFTNTLHSLASKISQNLTIHDNKVVWSPFLVVNSYVELEEKETEEIRLLRNGFESAGTYLTHDSPLKTTKILHGYTKNENLLNKTFLEKFPDNKDVNQLLQEIFLNATGHHTNQTQEDPQEKLKLQQQDSIETILLTAFSIDSGSLWATPFHPRYAKKSKFYLNSTHVTKTKFMNNIGFYKFADLSEELNATGIAMGIRGTNMYFLALKPNNPDALETLSVSMETVSNFTELFRKRFKTKRVQLSVPKFDIDSQFPIEITPTVQTLHISSLKLSYTGLYGNFHPPQQRPLLKFSRLRRRPDDIKFSLNSPFLFYLYDDSSFLSFLLSGQVLNPVSIETAVNPIMMMPEVPHEISVAKETSNINCAKEYESVRKTSQIYDDIFVKCKSNNTDYENVLNSTDLKFNFVARKNVFFKNFYRNEIEFVNASFGEAVIKVKYGSFGSVFDGRVVAIRNQGVNASSSSPSTLYIFLPNERSGLSLIEESLSKIPLSWFQCQLKDITMRLRLPDYKYEDLNGEFEIKNDVVKKSENDEDILEGGEIVFDDKRDSRARKNKPSTKKYRKLTVDRAFHYVVTSEDVRSGGNAFVAMGRGVTTRNSGGGGSGVDTGSVVLDIVKLFV